MREPEWLVKQVDERLATLGGPRIAAAARQTGAAVVMILLTELPDGASSQERDRWDRSCDRCGIYCPNKFYTGDIQRRIDGVPIRVTFGVCESCRERP